MEESNEASSEDRPYGPVLMCGKTLDEILAGRRGPAADSGKEPWWVPAVPDFETIVTSSDSGEQTPVVWPVEALERLWNDLYPPINEPPQDE